jgi:queuosine precursor transporter
VPIRTLVSMILTALKVSYEVLATPITYPVIHRLKAGERADAFDRHEDNPFSFADKSPLDAE